MSNIGLLQISYEDLAGMLGVPKGHTITDIIPQDANSVANQCFSVLVSGPQLPDHYDGSPAPYVSLVRDGRGRASFG